ncbi:MAG: hypothetical protein ACR2NQ_04375 [Thermodesulfobacteriota bacterium]
MAPFARAREMLSSVGAAVLKDGKTYKHRPAQSSAARFDSSGGGQVICAVFKLHRGFKWNRHCQ